MSYQLFTSESVAAGHPDKIADAISDALLDALLEQDPFARAGLETIVGANKIGLFGEIKTSAKVDFESIKNTGLSFKIKAILDLPVLDSH